ncbi:glycosyltransferase family 39 protein [Candidatus Beckwithbacteria bacterium]|nr:glycosyltransferase family 39 protein [Candidatus Beckwithbacteria bacterium]
MQKINKTIAHYFTYLLLAILFILSINLSYNAIFRHFDHDEYEHIHTTWYLTQSQLPYKDFYQHHNPLFWYALAPIVAIFNSSSSVLIAGRIFMLLQVLAMGFLVFKITKLITKNIQTSLLAPIFLFSTPFFIEKSYEIRPDVPQVLFGLASIYFLFHFLETKRVKSWILSAVLATFSFLFLQKTIFLLIAYVPVFLYLLVTKKIAIKHILFYGLAFLAPLLLFAIYLYGNQIFPDYILTNWLMNNSRTDSFSPTWIIKTNYGAFFFSITIISSIVLLLFKKFSLSTKIVAFLALALLASILMVNYPYLQYFLFPLPLLSVCLAIFISKIHLKFNPKSKLIFTILGSIGILALSFFYGKWQITLPVFIVLIILSAIYLGLHYKKLVYGQIPQLCLIILLILPAYYFSYETATQKSNSLDRKVIDLVLTNSRPTDKVYDGNINYNLFRPDLHYFWYSIGKDRGLDTYNRLTNNKYGDFNTCNLVITYKPKFISDYGLDIKTCGLEGTYMEVINRGQYLDAIYIRKN